MGLNWSKSTVVKDGTKLFMSADFPESQEQTQKLWQLWKIHKDAIKADGFSTTKDKFSHQFKIMYWHDLDNNDHVKDATGMPRWRINMLAKLGRWAEELENVVVEDTGRRGRKTKVELDGGNIPDEVITNPNFIQDRDADLSGDLMGVGFGAPKPAAAPKLVAKPAPKLVAKPAPKPAAAKAVAKPVARPMLMDPAQLRALAMAGDEEY